MALDDFEVAEQKDFKHVHVSGTGTTELVAAVTGKRIWVYVMILNGSAADKYTINSGANPLGIYDMAAADSFPVFGSKDSPIFVTNAGENLNVVVTGAGTSNVYIRYKQQPTI